LGNLKKESLGKLRQRRRIILKWIFKRDGQHGWD
jgi:hypothetical protein